MRGWKLILLIAVSCVVVVAAGCGGGGDSSEGVAAIETDADGSPASNSAGSGEEESNEDAALEWAQCMREHGADVGEPDENGMFLITPENSGPDDHAFERARDACGAPPLPDDLEPPSPEEAKRMQESMLAFTRCMRSNGIDLDDPTFEEGGASVGLPDPATVESPEFQAAQKKCSKYMQMPGAGNGSP